MFMFTNRKLKNLKNLKNSKKSDKILKYCNRYSLLLNLLLALLCIAYITYYTNYYPGVKYDFNSFVYRSKESYKNFNSNVVYGNDNNKNKNKKNKNDRDFYLLYIAACIALVYLCINTYVRIYHSKNEMVKYWIGITCLDNILGFLV